MDGGPKKIKDLLGSIVAKYGLSQTAAQAELNDAWCEVASENVRSHTRLGGLRRGQLEILVDSPALLSRLESFEKEKMLRGLQQRLRHNKIESLRFRRI